MGLETRGSKPHNFMEASKLFLDPEILRHFTTTALTIPSGDVAPHPWDKKFHNQRTAWALNIACEYRAHSIILRVNTKM